MSPEESEKLDSVTLTEWHRQYFTQISAFVYGIVRNKTITEEIVQVTFTKAFSSGGVVKAGSEKAWLFQVASNEALQFLRKHKAEQLRLSRIQSSSGKIKNSSENPVLQMMNIEQVESVRAALDRLPDHQRIIIQKKIYDEKTFQQISDELNIPLGTALTRMRTALQHLQIALKQENED